jgi:hypothetical protein
MKTINLLPKPQQQILRQEAIFRSLLSAGWLSVFSFALVILAQFGVKFYLQAEAQNIQSNIQQITAQVGKQENTADKNRITMINSIIADYKNLADASPKWSKVIKAFTKVPPDGVVIGSFTINFAQKSINITGTAPTREVVIALYNSILLDDSEFYGVDYPLENVAKPANVSFHFTFFIRDSLLK